MEGTFTTKIDIIGVNPFVRLPDEVLAAIFQTAGKSTSPIPVRGTINGATFQQSLVRYQGDWRLYINNVMAKSAGFKYAGSIVAIIGEQVTISVEYNPQPIAYAMMPEFRQALAADPRAKAAYDQLTPGRQKEMLRYLSMLKSQTSLKRNIGRLMHHLRGETSDALYALMHRKPRE